MQAGGVYVEQALFATSFYPESRNPRVKAFVEKFESLYNTTPSYLEAQAYDALTMLLQARSSERGGQADRNAIFQNLFRKRISRGLQEHTTCLRKAISNGNTRSCRCRTAS